MLVNVGYLRTDNLTQHQTLFVCEVGRSDRTLFTIQQFQFGALFELFFLGHDSNVVSISWANNTIWSRFNQFNKFNRPVAKSRSNNFNVNSNVKQVQSISIFTTAKAEGQSFSL